MSKAAYKGIVKGKTVVLKEPADLPEGSEVLVTPIAHAKGSPQALLAAIESPPHVDPRDVDEMIRLIEKGKRPVRYESPLKRKR